MADGLNDARAMRVAEILNDFRTISHQIQSYQASPPPQDAQLPGYAVLRQCQIELHALASLHFGGGNLQVPTSPGENTKRQLQGLITDASGRRFKAQKILQKAIAGARWHQRRNQILGGQQPAVQHTAALMQCDAALRTEVAASTDQKAYAELRAGDQRSQHWIGEDPSLAVVSQWARTH